MLGGNCSRGSPAVHYQATLSTRGSLNTTGVGRFTHSYESRVTVQRSETASVRIGSNRPGSGRHGIINGRSLVTADEDR